MKSISESQRSLESAEGKKAQEIKETNAQLEEKLRQKEAEVKKGEEETEKVRQEMGRKQAQLMDQNGVLEAKLTASQKEQKEAEERAKKEAESAAKLKQVNILMEEKIKGSAKEIAELKKSLESGSDAEKKAESLRQEKSAVEAERDGLKKEVESAKAENQKAKEELGKTMASLMDKNMDLEQKLSALKKEVAKEEEAKKEADEKAKKEADSAAKLRQVNILMEEKIKKSTKEIADLKEELSKKEGEVKAVEARVSEVQESSRRSLETEQQDKAEALKQEKSVLESEVQQLKKDLGEESERRKSLKINHDEMETKCKSLENDVEKLRRVNVLMEEKVRALSVENKQLNVDCEVKDETIRSLEQKAEVSQRAAEKGFALAAQVELLSGQVRELKQSMKEKDEEVEQLNKLCRKLEQEKADFEKKLTAVQNEQKEAEQKMRQAEENASKLKQVNILMEGKIKASSKENAELKEQLSKKESEVKATEVRVNDAQESSKRSLETGTQIKTQEKSDLEGKNRSLESQVESLKAENERVKEELGKSIAMLMDKNGELERRSGNLKRDLQQESARAQKAEEERERLRQVNILMEQKVNTLSKAPKSDDKQKEVVALLEQKLASQEKELTASKAKESEAEETVLRLKQVNVLMEQKVKELTEKLRFVQEKDEAADAKKVEAESKLKQVNVLLEERLKKSLKECEELKEKEKSTKADLDKAKAANSMLEEKLQKSQEEEERDSDKSVKLKQVNDLMKQKILSLTKSLDEANQSKKNAEGRVEELESENKKKGEDLESLRRELENKGKESVREKRRAVMLKAPGVKGYSGFTDSQASAIHEASKSWSDQGMTSSDVEEEIIMVEDMSPQSLRRKKTEEFERRRAERAKLSKSDNDAIEEAMEGFEKDNPEDVVSLKSELEEEKKKSSQLKQVNLLMENKLRAALSKQEKLSKELQEARGAQTKPNASVSRGVLLDTQEDLEAAIHRDKKEDTASQDVSNADDVNRLKAENEEQKKRIAEQEKIVKDLRELNSLFNSKLKAEKDEKQALQKRMEEELGQKREMDEEEIREVEQLRDLLRISTVRNNELEELNMSLIDKVDANAKRIETLVNTQQQLEERYQKTFATLESKVKEAEEEKLRAEVEAKETKDQLEKTEKDKNEVQQKHGLLAVQLSEKSEALERISRNQEQEESQRKLQLESERSSLEERLTESQNSIQSLEQQLESANTRSNELAAANARMTALNRELESKNVEMESSWNEECDKVSRLNKALLERQNQLQAKEAELAKQTQYVAELRELSRNQMQRKMETDAQNESKIEELEQEVQRLKDEVEDSRKARELESVSVRSVDSLESGAKPAAAANDESMIGARKEMLEMREKMEENERQTSRLQKEVQETKKHLNNSETALAATNAENVKLRTENMSNQRKIRQLEYDLEEVNVKLQTAEKIANDAKHRAREERSTKSSSFVLKSEAEKKQLELMRAKIEVSKLRKMHAEQLQTREDLWGSGGSLMSVSDVDVTLRKQAREMEQALNSLVEVVGDDSEVKRVAEAQPIETDTLLSPKARDLKLQAMNLEKARLQERVYEAESSNKDLATKLEAEETSKHDALRLLGIEKERVAFLEKQLKEKEDSSSSSVVIANRSDKTALADSQKKIEALTNEKKELERQLSERETRATAMVERDAPLERSAPSSSSEAEVLREERDKARNDLDTALDAVSKWEHQYVAATETTKRSQKKVSELQEELARLKEHLNQSSNTSLDQGTEVEGIPEKSKYCCLMSLDHKNPHVTLNPGGSASFGRDALCTVILNSKDISHRHCRIFYDTDLHEDGLAKGHTPFMLEDLSSNGVFVNFEKVGKGEKVRLRHGDLIWFSKQAVKHHTSAFAYVFQISSLVPRDTVRVPALQLEGTEKKIWTREKSLDGGNMRVWTSKDVSVYVEQENKE